MRADEVRILMDLERLGELIGAVCSKYAEVHGFDAPDFDAEEMRQVAIFGMQHCFHMADRAEFARSVASDLDDLAIAEEVRERDARDTGERISLDELIEEHYPEHRPEFGFFDPPV